MLSTNSKRTFFMHIFIILISTNTVLSAECTASVLYDFIYCLSPDSQCAQCMPCYNGGLLYIPTGQDYAAECANNHCAECIKTCSTDFKKHAYINDNSVLSSFISTMNASTISNISQSTKYEFDCTAYPNHVIFIKYAFFAANDNPAVNKLICTLDFSQNIAAACNQRTSCIFYLHSLLPSNCISSTTFMAEIGAFCVSTTPSYMSSDCSSADHEYVPLAYIIIIAVLATLLFVTILSIILCQIKHVVFEYKLNLNSASDISRVTVTNTNEVFEQRQTRPKFHQRGVNKLDINKSVTMHPYASDKNDMNTSVTNVLAGINNTVRSPMKMHLGNFESVHMPLPLVQNDSIVVPPVTRYRPKSVDDNISREVLELELDFDNDITYMLMNPNDDNEFADYTGNDQKMGNETNKEKDMNSNKIRCIAQREYFLDVEIGRGSSSKVYKVRWINGIFAAKRFINSFDIDSKKSQEYITTYAQKVADSPHENVIQILAFADNPFTIITEYINYGPVTKYVQSKRVSILDRIEIALQAAKGMEHLHKLGIIHSEIMCNNLLMEFIGNKKTFIVADIRVVVTDYALQQMLTDDGLETYRSSLGPLKYMAPELIDNHNNNTTLESDIYAFGITIWEILTGNEPYPDTKAVDAAIQVLIKKRRPQQYAFIPEPIQNLMVKCWNTDISQRPNANQVVNELEKYIQDQKGKS